MDHTPLIKHITLNATSYSSNINRLMAIDAYLRQTRILPLTAIDANLRQTHLVCKNVASTSTPGVNVFILQQRKHKG